MLKSQVKSKTIKVVNLFKVKREAEWDTFTQNIPNQRLLFHGSRIQNWVGLLSRGILLPKIVVTRFQLLQGRYSQLQLGWLESLQDLLSNGFV